MDYSRLFLYVIFGVVPSLTWLFYYIRKDAHPESKRMILKVFLWGALVTLPVFFVQIGLSLLLNKFNLPQLYFNIAYWFVVIALTEEVFKYLVARGEAFNNPEFDEPLDAMLYMVVAALGFAALENILYLLSPTDNLTFNDTLNRTMVVSFVRFIGATFLHTLCSGTLGYFVALSFSDRNKKRKALLFLTGLTIAVVFHGMYNFSIMTLQGNAQFIVPIIILSALAIFVISAFNKTKTMKSVSFNNKIQ